MPNYAVRKATQNDIDATFAFIAELYISQQRFYESANPINPDRLREIWSARLRSKACSVYMLEDKEELFGLIAGQISRHDSRNPTYREMIGIITEVYLAPEARGGDNAAALLEKIENWFLECGVSYIIADYFVENTASARFFERAGFSPLSTRVFKELRVES